MRVSPLPSSTHWPRAPDWRPESCGVDNKRQPIIYRGVTAILGQEKSMDEAAVTLAKAHLRVARPTDQLPEVVRFYRDGLDFEVLFEFNDHDGFDGIMLGHKGAAYHLEYTRKRGHTAGRAPTE